MAASAFVIQAVAEIFLKCDQNSFRVVQGRRFDDFLNWRFLSFLTLRTVLKNTKIELKNTVKHKNWTEKQD